MDTSNIPRFNLADKVSGSAWNILLTKLTNAVSTAVTSLKITGGPGETGDLTLNSGTGIVITDSPAGTFNVANTGVTSLTAGTNISLSGSTGNVTVNSTATGFQDPTTTPGDIIYRNDANVTTRRGIGTNGQVLTAVPQFEYDAVVLGDNPYNFWKFNQGSLADAGSFNNGILSGLSLSLTGGPFSDGYVVSPNRSLSGTNENFDGISFSQEMWFATTTVGGNGVIVGLGNQPNSNYQAVVNFQMQGGTLFGPFLGPGTPWNTGFTPASDGVFRYYVITYDGSTLRLYINGALQASRTTSIMTVGTMQVGIGGASVDYFTTWNPWSSGDGLSRVALYRYTLSATQITNHWNASGGGNAQVPDWRNFLTSLSTQTVGTTQATIAHGLGIIPSFVILLPTSAGQIWQSAAADNTNIYLTADSAGRTCIPYVR